MAVIRFPGTDTSDDPAPDSEGGIEKCLELAGQRDLAEVFIVGRKKAGDVWFTTNDGDVGNILFLLETAKAIIIKETLSG